MLIPAIDLKNGRVVQLVQGERLAVEDADLDAWIARFRRFPRVQVIDLDAAMRTGSNTALVRRVCAQLPCRVGGGLRTPEAARAAIEMGAHAAIVGSALFANGSVNVDQASAFADAVGRERLIAAVDSRGGHVVVNGWRTVLDVTPTSAIARLERFCGEFLYTHVDTEGLMAGIDMDAVRAVRAATTRRVTVAGGVRTQDEVDALDRLGVDAVVGMAIYTGAMRLDEPWSGGSRQSPR